MGAKHINERPTSSFKDGVLVVPGYNFDATDLWEDVGVSSLYIAAGVCLKDDSNVLAKICPSNSKGSMCLEREAQILKQIATSPQTIGVTLRLIEFFMVPKANGHCVVLILSHPGANSLAQYKLNSLLLAEVSLVVPPHEDDIYMMVEDLELFDLHVMDLASFLEFAIQATHCLEMIHRLDIVHGEIRANAFHWNADSGLVRLVHFGNRLESLEQLCRPSFPAIQGFTNEVVGLKQAICYLAPEQVEGYGIATLCDHRTDLYSLGVLFWTLVVGRATLPFEGSPMTLLHEIVQKKPLPACEVRKDVPAILSSILDKLLAKNPDDRYQSAYGLQQDLCNCQTQLQTQLQNGVTPESISVELISPFEIATQDKYMHFVFPSTLVGRDDELALIENVIQNSVTSFSQQFYVSGDSHHFNLGNQDTDLLIGASSKSTRTGSPDRSWGVIECNSKLPSSEPSRGRSPASNSLSSSHSMSGNFQVADGRSNGSLNGRTSAVFVVGPSGAGKSSLIRAYQARWRSQGLWAEAKFQEHESAPFAVLLACLSSVLRQLMLSPSDSHRFAISLEDSLGEQMQNIYLLYDAAPELRDLVGTLDDSHCRQESLSTTAELRGRFLFLVQKVFSVLAETRLLALFLDDIHDAPEASLELIQQLIALKTSMVIFATIRSEYEAMYRDMFKTSNRLRAAWIALKPLSSTAVNMLVSKTLRRGPDSCISLSRYIYELSSGNAFSARRILTDLQRQRLIVFDFDKNYWQYDVPAMEPNNIVCDVTGVGEELSFYVSLFRDLPEDTKDCLIICALLGSPCNITELKTIMEWEFCGNSSDEDDTGSEPRISKATTCIIDTIQGPGLMRGLQTAITEGWLVVRARETCSFAHDRYRFSVTTETERLPAESIANISLKIILMLLRDADPDAYRIAKHCGSCLTLLRNHPQRNNIIQILITAAASARARGAHELALQVYSSARSLFANDCWDSQPKRTFEVLSRLAELSTWRGNCEESNDIIHQCLVKAEVPEEKAEILRLRSTNHWMRGNYTDALRDTLSALNYLDVPVNAAPSRQEADVMFEDVRNEILDIGRDEILAIPRASDYKTDLAVALLNDAGINAYWSTGEGFADVIGLTAIRLALRYGMSPSTGIGFFWALGAAAGRREMYRFSVDLAKLALDIAELHGGNMEKCRTRLLYSAMVSGFDNLHIRSNLPRLQQAHKYGTSAGDRLYTIFATVAIVETRLFICDHLSELMIAAEDCLHEVKLWQVGADTDILVMGVLNCVRGMNQVNQVEASLNKAYTALGGYTYAQSAETAFDIDDFSESKYLAHVRDKSGNPRASLNWYNAFKVVGYFCIGFIDEAAELGFSVHSTRDTHPNHRHIRYALFFHSLAMIACIRKGQLTSDNHRRYMKQIDINQRYLRKWLSPSPVNTSTWVTLVDAEIASVQNNPDAARLYDVAVKLAVNNDWLLEEGWALYLQGCHFMRQSIEGLGIELQRKGISRQSKWGAKGILNYMTREMGDGPIYPLKRPLFTSEASVQTALDMNIKADNQGHLFKTQLIEDESLSSLSQPELVSIMKWSGEISQNMNLFSALERFTEIASEFSKSQKTCVVIIKEAGEYRLVTSFTPPEPCQIYDDFQKPIEMIADAVQKAVLYHVISTKQRFNCDDAHSDSRISWAAKGHPHQSVSCVPIFNRRQMIGAVYFTSESPFSQKTIMMQQHLCHQASINIANALLFRAVDRHTKDNLKVINMQNAALDSARASRNQAVQATKTKTNFLATMSHELRTPFSSFYGHMELLNETQLDANQKDIVKRAQDSCELLLNVIDSILDYSKLEAAAVRLCPSEFSIERLIADCVELLLPNAATKLDLAFNIEEGVPAWVTADSGRIRQVVMNLVGNAVKFTAKGSVNVVCSTNKTPSSSGEEVLLTVTIHDTGIGLSPSDMDLLFVPFQQADNTSTRRYGGTGLGLSISRQLVDLMKGKIDAKSQLGHGSTFWFTVPVIVSDSATSRNALSEIEKLRFSLTSPHQFHVLICSPSKTTISMLSTILKGLVLEVTTSIEEAENKLRKAHSLHRPIDFLILDDQSEVHLDYLARVIEISSDSKSTPTQLVHFHTFTTGWTGVTNPNVVKMSKPPRTYELLTKLGELSRCLSPRTTKGNVPKKAAVPRTLYGNVLVAEDNPVTRHILVTKLERLNLSVTQTCDGNEAVQAWQSHPPGYFSVALFDHHMPSCDGVEATKKLRILEKQAKVSVELPIVALSADCQEQTRKLCISAGMNMFFTKPMKHGDLISLMSMFGSSHPV